MFAVMDGLSGAHWNVGFIGHFDRPLEWRIAVGFGSRPCETRPPSCARSPAPPLIAFEGGV